MDSIPFVSCNRLRNVQKLLGNGLDAILIITGIDSLYNKGSHQLCNYLLFDVLNQKLTGNKKITDELIDDVVMVIRPNCVHLYCNPVNYDFLQPLVTSWYNLCLHCLDNDTYKKVDVAEDFKIDSFIAMVTDCNRIGVCYSGEGELADFHFMNVEAWPLVQAFANETYQRGGFFTLQHEVKDISSEVHQLMSVVDRGYLETIITKHLPSFEHQWNVMLQSTAHAIQSGRREITEDRIKEPLETYYRHTCLNLTHHKHKESNRNSSSSNSSSRRPFVFVGPNASRDHILNQKSSSKHPPLTYDVTDTQQLLLVCQEVSAKVPLLCCRTYFIERFHLTDNACSGDTPDTPISEPRSIQFLYLCLIKSVLSAIDVYKDTASGKQAQTTAYNVLVKSAASLKFDALQRHIGDRKNLEFVLQDVDDQIRTKNSTRNNLHVKPKHSSTLQWIQMSIWNIPDFRKQGGSHAGSLSFGEVFLVSSFLLTDKASRVTCSAEVQILTSQIPRHHCWTTVPIPDNISEMCDKLQLSELLGDFVCDGSNIEVVDTGGVWDVVRSGHLYMLQNGLVVHLSGQNPVVVPNSCLKSLDVYHKDSGDCAAMVFLKIDAAKCNVHLLVPSPLKTRVLGFLFHQGSRAHKILYSKLLPYWKNGPIPVGLLKTLPDNLTQLYSSSSSSSSSVTPGGDITPGQKMTLQQASNHLYKLDSFLDHLLVSCADIKQPIRKELASVLLKLPTTTTTTTTTTASTMTDAATTTTDDDDDPIKITVTTTTGTSTSTDATTTTTTTDATTTTTGNTKAAGTTTSDTSTTTDATTTAIGTNTATTTASATTTIVLGMSPATIEANKRQNEMEDKVIITILAGIRGSQKENFCKTLTRLAKDYTRWLVLQQPIRNPEQFDPVRLQQYLSSSIRSQSQQMCRSASGGHKHLRIILVALGYTEIMDIVRAIQSHPEPDIAAQMVIGSVTVCVNPENSWLENRMMLPTVWNQCLQGWVNNILFIISKKSERNTALVKDFKQSVKKQNHNINFLTLNEGYLNSISDVDLILSEDSFNSEEMMRSRHLLTPNWQDPVSCETCYKTVLPLTDTKLRFNQLLNKALLKANLKELKDQLVCYPFRGNIYHVRGQVQFLGESSLSEVQYITVSGQLTIDKANFQPHPPPPPPSSSSPSPQPQQQQQQQQARFFMIFTGSNLDRDRLKSWLQSCVSKMSSHKPYLDRQSLSSNLKKLIQKRHSVDQLPPGWFFNGQSYVSLTGQRSDTHPQLDEFLDEFTAKKNSHIALQNERTDRRNQENILQFFEGEEEY